MTKGARQSPRASDLGPLRFITARKFITGHNGCNKGAGSVWLTLECGHQTACKASQEPKRRARCSMCHYAPGLRRRERKR